MDKHIKKSFNIDGMVCKSCEERIEEELKKLEGIKEVKADYSTSKLDITFDEEKVGIEKIKSLLEGLNYKIIKDTKENQNNKDKDAINILELVAIGVIILAVYLIIEKTIGFNFIPKIETSMGYGVLFIVGVLTSIHCITMCGGINLSVCLNYKKTDSNKKYENLMPSIFYNSGRVISYTIIGGIVGALGAVISFSGYAKGLVAIISGIFMLIMGLNMLNLIPWLKKLNPRMPKIFGEKVRKGATNKGPFYVGILNGFMPCGPLQAMQIYALGTGSFFTGALSMFMFSIGTFPLMFGFGAFSSILSKKFTNKMLKVSAVLVMILGIVMFNRGLILSGFSINDQANIKNVIKTEKNVKYDNVAKIENGVQFVTIKLEPSSYKPITVQKGIPVKWTIKAEEGDINGCNNAIIIPKYGIEKKLNIGDNIIEFTPSEEGNITYSCWMGMITSNIKVVTDVNKLSDTKVIENKPQEEILPGGCCGVKENSNE